MDNRYATLPVFGALDEETGKWSFGVQGAWTSTRTGELSSSGVLFAVFAKRSLSDRWALAAFGFMDTLSLTGDNDYRPLQTLFAPTTPIHRPVDAVFDNLDGTLRHFGGGLNVSLATQDSRIGAYRWTAGVLWETIE